MLRARTILIVLCTLSAHCQCALAQELFGLTESGKLVRFDSSNPDTLLPETKFDIDISPTNDVIRVVSDTGGLLFE